MMWPQLQTIAQNGIGRVLNSLPEGVLIALFAAAMLQLLPRQNSGTRFAVWFVALLSVAVLPIGVWPAIGGLSGNLFQFAGKAHTVVSVPESWGMILFLAWLLTASVGILRLASGLWRLRVLRKSCVSINGMDLDPAIRQAVYDFSSSRSVELTTSERIIVPAAMGFFKPMIVLPAWALRDLTPAELNVVLLHEFAHLRRGDAWTNLVQKIVRSVLPFHPAVCWIDGRLSLEREMACDDQVLAETANPRGYAQCLIALLEKSAARRGWAMAQAAVHRAGEASRRIAQILDARRPDGKRVWKPALGLVGTFSLLCLVVVPHVPRFVAFDSGSRPLPNDNVHSAFVHQSEMPAAAVISAAMPSGSSFLAQKTQRQSSAQTVRHLSEHLPERRIPARPAIAARWSSGDEINPAAATNVRMKHSDVSASETLLIIRTAQQVGPNAWVWSVGVWRVNVVNPVPDRSEAAPVAKKT
jgi:beta-lactamase regulating signal transducer with metallopeptidase domain